MIHKCITKAFFLLFGMSSLCFCDLLWGLYFAPGVKIGYQIGKKSGLIIGVETSLNYFYMRNTSFVGIVGGIHFNANNHTISKYCEGQAGFAALGAAFGKQWEDGNSYSLRIFTGVPSLFSYGKYSVTSFVSYKYLFSFHASEIMVIGKYPLPLFQAMDYGYYLFGKSID